MTIVYVELSGESPSLARAEATSAAESLGGGAVRPAVEVENLLAVEVPDERRPGSLADRLALARRTLSLVAVGDGTESVAARAGSTRASASFRPLGRPSGGADPSIRALGRAYAEGGGRIDLEHPERRFWAATDRAGRPVLLEEISVVDRGAIRRRRMPLLPFQRPVSLPPKFARAAANLARIRPGDRVLDPFLGTGALLAEAGLLGARAFGIDLDPAMARGALRNFAYLGVPVESLLVGDAGSVEFEPPDRRFEAILTDPPYGRASTTGGEGAEHLIERVLDQWAERVVPGGRVVVIVPAGAPPCLSRWEARIVAAVRAHRSLTREFRVYERNATVPGAPMVRRSSR